MRSLSQISLAAALLSAPALASTKPSDDPICADRPAKGNATCTVPAGHFQIETGLADWSLSKADGVRTSVSQVGASTLKFGLDPQSDLEVALQPYVAIRTKAGPLRERVSGSGDVVVRYKRRLGNGDKIHVAPIPFIKLPTAHRGIGNGKVEGGLAVPVTIPTGGPVSIVLGPEIDLLADADGHGRHAQIVNLINLSATVVPRLTVVGEAWTASNFDPSGKTTYASADAALSYLASRRVQVDAGINVGLTRATPRVELYTGTSFRF